MDVAGLDPAPPVAVVADMPRSSSAAVARQTIPLRALTGQVELGVPLPMPATKRAGAVELPAAVLDRDALEGMRIVGGEAVHDAGFVGHGSFMIHPLLGNHIRDSLGGLV